MANVGLHALCAFADRLELGAGTRPGVAARRQYVEKTFKAPVNLQGQIRPTGDAVQSNRELENPSQSSLIAARSAGRLPSLAELPSTPPFTLVRFGVGRPTWLGGP